MDLLGCGAALLLAACPQVGLSRAEREVVEWAAGRALPLESLEPGALDASALTPLERELEGVRIVCLGEPDHFIHEKYVGLLIGWLLERGFRHVAMEMGHSDAWRMDRYLATGDEAWLERVAL